MSEGAIEEKKTPYELLGGTERIHAIVEAFYDAMEVHEPALARLHEQDAPGKVSRGSRDRFASFLCFWLGGPRDYLDTHGHPRLRMRHGRVPVNVNMRDAWLRSMERALDQLHVEGAVRDFLDGRFAEVADFLRNVPE